MVCDDRSGGPVLDVGWWGWRRGIAVLLNRFEPVDQRVRRGQTLMLTLKKLAGKSEIQKVETFYFYSQLRRASRASAARSGSEGTMYISCIDHSLQKNLIVTKINYMNP